MHDKPCGAKEGIEKIQSPLAPMQRQAHRKDAEHDASERDWNMVTFVYTTKAQVSTMSGDKDSHQSHLREDDTHPKSW